MLRACTCMWNNTWSVFGCLLYYHGQIKNTLIRDCAIFVFNLSWIGLRSIVFLHNTIDVAICLIWQYADWDLDMECAVNLNLLMIGHIIWDVMQVQISVTLSWIAWWVELHPSFWEVLLDCARQSQNRFEQLSRVSQGERECVNLHMQINFSCLL